MGKDVESFVRRICFVDGAGEGSYFQTPVLKFIDPDAFIRSFLKMHAAKQRRVMIGLQARYEHGKLNRELASEKSWLEQVKNKLVEEVRSRAPMEKYRLEKMIIDSLAGILKSAEGA